MGGILGISPQMWALQKLGENLPTGLQNYASSLGTELVQGARQTMPFEVGEYLAGATPEEVAQGRKEAQDIAQMASQSRLQTGVGRAVERVLGSQPPTSTPTAKPAFKSPVSPPAATTPQPSVAAPTGPTQRNTIRMVTDPATGRQVFVNDNTGPDQTVENNSAVAEYKIRGALPGNAASNPATMGQNGVVNPLGFSTRNTPGTYSYAGTQGFNRDTVANLAAHPDEAALGKLHPLEQREVLEQQGRNMQAQEASIQQRMAMAKLKQEEAAAEEADNPALAHQNDVQQYLTMAQKQLDDPSTLLGTRYKLAQREYMIKNPQATQDQLDQFDAILRQSLTTEEAQRNASMYGSLIQQYDPRVLSALARNSLGFGMPGGGLGSPGVTPPQR